jgi:hypothetical protein
MLLTCRPEDSDMVLLWKKWPDGTGPYTTPDGIWWKMVSRHALVRREYLDRIEGRIE